MENIYLQDGDVLITRIKQLISKDKIIKTGERFGDEILQEDIIIQYANKDDIKAEFLNWYYDIKTRLNIDKVYFCLSDRKSFRYKINPFYKKRDVEDLKVYLNQTIRKEIMELEIEGLYFVHRELLEADDLLSIYATYFTQEKNYTEVYVGTIDKDLKTVPNIYYHNMIDDTIRYISYTEANKFFYCQLLMGDKQDNIIGLKGYGIVSAEKFVNKYYNDVSVLYKMIEKEYISQGFTEYDCLKNARLLHLLNYKEYNRDSGCIKYFIPPVTHH